MKHAKVLLVDDTETLLSVIQIYLMGMELDFLVARDGEEGLEKARAERPAIVITDVRMPKMDGFELCAAIRSDRELQQTPVILLTALQDDASREKGKIVGASAFLTKPVTVTDLRKAVEQFLGERAR